LEKAICIKDEMVTGDDVTNNSNEQCGKTVNNNSNNYWRCDAFKERPTLENYKDNMDMDKLEEFERDVKRDKGDRDVEKFIKQPTGWDKGVRLEGIGLSDYILKEIIDDPVSNIAEGDCDDNKWCEKDPTTSKLRSCSMNVIFYEDTSFTHK